MTIHDGQRYEANAAFKRRQRVNVLHGVGAEPATICKPQTAPHADWYVVKFDDGRKLSIHTTNLSAVR